MNPLAYFRWYRRARGGYWAQVTLPFIGVRWLRVSSSPPPQHEWTFWPWGTRKLGNGYIDEWHLDACTATPLSRAIAAVAGTADPAEIKHLVDELTALRMETEFLKDAICGFEWQRINAMSADEVKKELLAEGYTEEQLAEGYAKLRAMLAANGIKAPI